MKCIIVDDEAMARLITNQLCSKIEDLKVVGQFSNAMETIKFLNQKEVDLIFLDIHMPGFNGFDLIQSLKNPPKIILTTTDRNFAINAFEYDFVVDYLLKPIDTDRFVKAIEKARNMNTRLPQKPVLAKEEYGKELYVNIDRRLIKIDFSEISVIEAKGDYIRIKTDKKNHIVHSTMKKIEGKLPPSTFLKVHRSYVINTNKIVDIEDNSVLIQQDIIPVSRSNRNQLMRRLNLL